MGKPDFQIDRLYVEINTEIDSNKVQRLEDALCNVSSSNKTYSEITKSPGLEDVRMTSFILGLKKNTGQQSRMFNSGRQTQSAEQNRYTQIV